MTLIAPLVALLVILAACYGCFWLIDSGGVPAPMNLIMKMIIVVIGLYAILSYVLPAIG